MSDITLIYIITAVASVVVAVFLIKLGMSISNSRRNVRTDEKESRLDAYDLAGEGSLEQTIFGEIRDVVYPKYRCSEISRNLSDLFGRELAKRVESRNRLLNAGERALIEETEIPWQKYRTALATQRATDAVVRSIAEGLVVIDKDGKVLMVNPAAENLLGISGSDIEDSVFDRTYRICKKDTISQVLSISPFVLIIGICL